MIFMSKGEKLYTKVAKLLCSSGFFQAYGYRYSRSICCLQINRYRFGLISLPERNHGRLVIWPAETLREMSGARQPGTETV
jgi:hypothetical protein